MTDTFFKQPAEVLDYDFDFSQWVPAGDSLPESISTSVVVATGLTLGVKTHPGSAVVKQFISGGTSGVNYKVTCTITTTQGRVKEVDIILKVRDL